MRSNPLRNLLNRLIWDKRLSPESYEIVFRSRGAEGDMETISASQIVKVYQRGFEADIGGKRIYVPFHRIIKVKNKFTGEELYYSSRA